MDNMLMPPGVEGARLYYGVLLSAFPGGQVILDDAIAEGDQVACRFTFRGTHQGEFMNIPATGKEIMFTGVTVMRFSGSKCVERWSQTDDVAMLVQLGVMPAPGSGG